ncbi:MAG: adenylylsulfate reductase, subunit [Halanaerobiales bacterium]|nr:adenylylsulfate reductase, subunit [Halanaerobiales bacterium]
MSVKIDLNLCTGCAGQEEAFCIKYCPGDLLAIDKETGKPYIRSERDCWDCMVCVKACPFEAIETRLPYQLASYKASLKPKVYKEKIVWKLNDINGREEIYELQTGG